MQAAVSQDYIGGLSLSEGEQSVVVAAADGAASLLDMRKSGAEVSRVACGAPLHCATSDGRAALLGREDGQAGCPLLALCSAFTIELDQLCCQSSILLSLGCGHLEVILRFKRLG